MAGWQEGKVETNGVHLHYTRTGGDKTPIVLAHGLTDNGLAWSRLAHILEPTFDFVMVDARGHGLSDKPETGYAPVEHMRDLVGVIEALELQRPIVMGHSMGAVTASMVSAEYPDLVRGTILEDPVWRWPAPVAEQDSNRRAAYENWKSRLAYRQTLTPEESFVRGRRERPLWAIEDHDADVPAKLQVAMQALEYVLEPMPDWTEEVTKFKSPTLLIYGNPTLGSIVGPDVAAQARQLNPLIMPIQIPNAGHSIRRESFESYVAAVREFLARVLRG